MPRGVRALKDNVDAIEALVAVAETDDEIEQRIGERFDILEALTDSCIAGNSRALIVSGSPGVGKSYGINRALEKYDPTGNLYSVVKGYSRATGMIKLLYQHRHPGNILVFDDCDSVFADDISLNLLKAVVDTCDNRRVSWLSEGRLLDEETGEMVPRHFDFEGTVIFLTNLDFDAMIARGHKLAPHLEALQSRAHYLDLSLKTSKDKIARIRQVVEQGLLSHLDLEAQVDVLTFVESYYTHMRELSLRAVIKLGALRANNSNWEKIARITMLK
jgi:hypothetical protein